MTMKREILQYGQPDSGWVYSGILFLRIIEGRRQKHRLCSVEWWMIIRRWWQARSTFRCCLPPPPKALFRSKILNPVPSRQKAGNVKFPTSQEIAGRDSNHVTSKLTVSLPLNTSVLNILIIKFRSYEQGLHEKRAPTPCHHGTVCSAGVNSDHDRRAERNRQWLFHSPHY